MWCVYGESVLDIVFGQCSADTINVFFDGDLPPKRDEVVSVVEGHSEKSIIYTNEEPMLIYNFDKLRILGSGIIVGREDVLDGNSINVKLLIDVRDVGIEDLLRGFSVSHKYQSVVFDDSVIDHMKASIESFKLRGGMEIVFEKYGVS